MANHSKAEALSNPKYEQLDGLTRCLHFNALKQCYKKEMLLPHTLKSKVVDTYGVGKVLWFGPNKDPSEHNKYGNVSFTISMQDVIRRFGNQFYYIDSMEYKSLVVTRLLLTEKDYDQFESVDLSEHGSPLKRGRWRHVATCDGNKLPFQQHEVEIGIEVDKEDCRWLYDVCDADSANHSHANTTKGKSRSYQPHVCHKFNNFGLNCPYNYDEEEAFGILQDEYSNLCESDSESDGYDYV